MKDINRQIFVYPQSFFLKYNTTEVLKLPREKKDKALLSVLDFSLHFEKDGFHKTNPTSINSGYLNKIKAANKKLIRKSFLTSSEPLLCVKFEPKCKYKKVIIKSSSKVKKTNSNKVPFVPSENLPLKSFSNRIFKSLK